MSASLVLNNQDLVSCICHSLKYDALSDQVRQHGEDARSFRDDSFLNAIRPLTTVNKSFFQGSIKVLWERLDSLRPLFGCVIPVLDDDNVLSIPSVSTTNDISRHTWDRFRLYASKVKILLLGGYTPVKHPFHWLDRITKSPGRPRPLFSALSHLIVGSDDVLSNFIAHDAMTTIRRMDFDTRLVSTATPPPSYSLALVATATSKGVMLTELRMDSIATPDCISQLVRMPTLITLHIEIPNAASIDALRLHQLTSLPHLIKLRLRQHTNTISEAGPIPDPIVSMIPATSQDPVFSSIDTLSVEADCITQARVAATMNLHGLRELRLFDSTPHHASGQLVLLPFILLFYASKNSSLITLSAIHLYDHHPVTFSDDEWTQVASDDSYNCTDDLSIGLSNLHELETLEIVDFALVDRDFIVHLAATVSTRLHNLRTLRLTVDAESRSGGERDTTLVPWPILQRISFLNSCLVELDIPIDITTEPDLSAILRPLEEHGLAVIGFNSKVLDSWLEEHQHDIDPAHAYKVASYLHMLFPKAHVKSVTVTGMWFWTLVETHISLFRSESVAE